MPLIAIEDGFKGALRSLPPDRKKAAIKSLTLFIDTPNLPRFRFRPLKGLDGHFIINAKRGDRIILRKTGEDAFAAVDVGPHDNIYRRWDRR